MVPVSHRAAVRLVWSDGQHANRNKLLLLEGSAAIKRAVSGDWRIKWKRASACSPVPPIGRHNQGASQQRAIVL